MSEPTYEIKLSHPITSGTETIDTLVLRRPKARDFRQLKGMEFPFAMILDFAADLSGLTPNQIDRLDVDDMPKVIEVVSGFLGQFPGTGKT